MRLWHLVLMENRFHRALGGTGSAINATIGVDVQHFGPFVKTLSWANSYAGGVFATDTSFCDNVGHKFLQLG